MEELLKPDVYQFWFGLIQVVVLIGGVIAGIISIRSVLRTRRSESLLRVLTELQDAEFTANAKTVIDAFPARGGSLEMRVEAVLATQLSSDEVRSARVVVECLNDMVHEMELNLFRERELLRTAHPRIVDLAYRLEPFVMVVSAQRAHAWGWRVRRLLVGARRYYQRSPVYKDDTFIHPQGEKGDDGQVLIWFSPILPVWRRNLAAWSYKVGFTRHLTPTAKSTRAAYAEDRKAVAMQIASFEASHGPVSRFDIF